MGGDITLFIVFLILFGLGCAIFFYAWRTWQIQRRIGAFPCTVLLKNKQVEGICLFGVKTISFYRTFSFSMRPNGQWERKEIEIINNAPIPIAGNSQSEQMNNETITLEERQDLLVVTVKIAGTQYQVCLRASAFAAVISWLDAAGPTEEPLIL